MEPVPYSGSLMGDLYMPNGGTGQVPAVLAVHGTGWWGGRRTDWDNDCGRIALTGKIAMSADYSLAPPHGTAHFRQPVDELIAAVTYLKSLPRCNGKVGAIGSSAGGHLVTMLAIEGVVDCAVSWSGPVNLPLGHHAFPNGPIVFDQEENFLDSTDHAEPVWLAASPLVVAQTCAPIWFANSTDEVIPVEGARDWDQWLTAQGIDHYFRELPGTAHARAYRSTVWAASVAWLNDHLA